MVCVAAWNFGSSWFMQGTWTLWDICYSLNYFAVPYLLMRLNVSSIAPPKLANEARLMSLLQQTLS